jgi:hypothetical protein
VEDTPLQPPKNSTGKASKRRLSRDREGAGLHPRLPLPHGRGSAYS